jgi:ACS family hexuronate transporter-like MFS transporter
MQPIGKYRWTICGLVFFATTINYLDRSVISLLKPFFDKEFSWKETDYSHIVISFQVAYALGMIGLGRFIDKTGTKIGYAVSTLVWSLAAMAHALANSTFSFGAARAALGISEAGNFPAAIKTIAEWFPKKERAFATGVFNSGTNIGAIVAPLTVPWIATNMGWQWAFIITGAIGFIWLILWLAIYEIPAKHKRLSKEEYLYIHSDVEDSDAVGQADGKGESVSWFRLLRFKQTWAFVSGKFLTDPVLWFYLYWLPAFLTAQYHIEGKELALPVALVYTMAGFGSVGGGWLPTYLVRKNWPLFRARKTSMLMYAIFVIPVVFAQWLGSINMWLAVLIIGYAASLHQSWSANIFTTASDMFPKRVVAYVTGLGGMAGAIGGILIAWFAGVLFEHYKSLGKIEIGYYIMFLICGFAYLTAWLIMHVLTPTMRRVDI